jgi:transposase-like protein
VPKPYPEEFRQDVVRVARNRGPGVTVEQVAADFGVHAMTLWKWMRRADIDDGTKPGTTSQDNAELREARRRIKLLEQENEVLRRAAAYLSQAHLPGTSSSSMTRLRPDCTTQAAVGCAVAPRTRILRVACSITANTYNRAPVNVRISRKSHGSMASA